VQSHADRHEPASPVDGTSAGPITTSFVAVSVVVTASVPPVSTGVIGRSAVERSAPASPEPGELHAAVSATAIAHSVK
jgi:hypothetical protein